MPNANTDDRGISVPRYADAMAERATWEMESLPSSDGAQRVSGSNKFNPANPRHISFCIDSLEGSGKDIRQVLIELLHLDDPTRVPRNMRHDLADALDSYCQLLIDTTDGNRLSASMNYNYKEDMIEAMRQLEGNLRALSDANDDSAP